MAKKGKAESVENRRKLKRKQKPIVESNPFEIRVNRVKHEIIGRKEKHDRGLPGLSRSKAMKKREGLVKEYKTATKLPSHFVDKRFGEYDTEMSIEDKMLKRFTLEKQHHHEKAGNYNLEDDDDDLTHFGQSLAELENFDDAGLKLSGDESEQEDISESHFGGFLTKKTDRDPNDATNDKPRSRKEIMEEMVKKSKQKKFEKQQAQEEAFLLTQELDKQWKGIQGLLPAQRLKDDAASKADDYDKTVRELFYESKAKPTNRLKTEEEIAQEELDRLKKLEMERKRRMNGITEESTSKHRSADDLGDEYETVVDKRVEIRYKDGKMIPGIMDHEALENDDEDDDEDDDDGEAGSDSENGETGDEDDEEFEDQDNENEEEDEGSDNNECKEEGSVAESIENQLQNLNTDVQIDNQKELPFTFDAPSSFKQLKIMFKNRDFNEQLIIIERIRKCHNPKLSKANISKMEAFFVVLLEYVDYLSRQIEPQIDTINKLAKMIFIVGNDSPRHTAKVIQMRLQLMIGSIFKDSVMIRFPSLGEILLFQIIAILFPTTDLRHKVVTPALLCMTRMLAKVNVKSKHDVISGLYLCTVVHQYIKESKRFVPEVFNFLNGVICCCAGNTKSVRATLKRLPFKATKEIYQELDCQSIPREKSLESLELDLQKGLGDKKKNINNASSRYQILHCCVNLFQDYFMLYKYHSSATELFQICNDAAKELLSSKIPKSIKEICSSLCESLANQPHKQPLTYLSRKPVPLRLLEPKFKESYDVFSKRNTGSKVANDREKMKYKVKRETKGAIREIRKDNQVIAKEKLKETLVKVHAQFMEGYETVNEFYSAQIVMNYLKNRSRDIEKDATRKRKVKELERMVSDQQGEFKAMERMKRNKR